jgi:hypothetical protein
MMKLVPRPHQPERVTSEASLVRGMLSSQSILTIPHTLRNIQTLHRDGFMRVESTVDASRRAKESLNFHRRVKSTS